MQYQHLVFEEFGRRVQPQINLFAGYQTEIDPAISAEFAHTVYRFGHSMLTETVDRTDLTGLVVPAPMDIDLFDAFLNPVAFNDVDGNPATAPVSAAMAAGSIVRACRARSATSSTSSSPTRLRNRLVGLPLDLAAINMARGRSEGIPGLNEARRQFFAATGEPALAPYESWADFSFNLKHARVRWPTSSPPTARTRTSPRSTPTGPVPSWPAASRRVARRSTRSSTAPRCPARTAWRRRPGHHLRGPDDPVGCDESADDIIAPADSLDFLTGAGPGPTWPGSPHRPRRDRLLGRRPGREAGALRRPARHDLQLRLRDAAGGPPGRRPVLLPVPHRRPQPARPARGQLVLRADHAQHRPPARCRPTSSPGRTSRSRSASSARAARSSTTRPRRGTSRRCLTRNMPDGRHHPLRRPASTSSGTARPTPTASSRARVTTPSAATTATTGPRAAPATTSSSAATATTSSPTTSATTSSRAAPATTP